MAKKFLTNLDLTKNQILNVALQNLGTPPGSPVSGQIYFNTTDARIYFWDGTAWVDISGDLRSVFGGNGLTATYSADGDEVTLDVNVDNVTIEINSDSLRIKDLGVSTAKLADSAVTTVKINNNAVTLAKFQQIAALKLLANVTGSTANVQEVDIKTVVDGTAADTNLPTTKAVKDYVDAKVVSLGNLEGGWDASSGSFPVGSTPTGLNVSGAGTKAGDYWYVTVAGTVDSEPFNVGDVIVAKVNSASTSLKSDWIRLESNRDQATESVMGVAAIATQTETNTGANDTDIVTPQKLAGRTATETRTGIAEIATQAETDAGLDDERIVTPYKLVTYITNRTGGYAANVGNGSATSFALTHGLNAADVLVAIYDNSTKEEVIADVVITSSSVVTVSFATAPSSNAYRVVIKK